MIEICPSCKKLLRDRPDLWKELDPVLVRNALSRRDNKTYICDTCGVAEAMADYLHISDELARWDLVNESA